MRYWQEWHFEEGDNPYSGEPGLPAEGGESGTPEEEEETSTVELISEEDMTLLKEDLETLKNQQYAIGVLVALFVAYYLIRDIFVGVSK